MNFQDKLSLVSGTLLLAWLVADKTGDWFWGFVLFSGIMIIIGALIVLNET